MSNRNADQQRAYRAARAAIGRPLTSGRSGKKISQFDRADFIAWDGEGVDDAHEEYAEGLHKWSQRYVLLANDRGDVLWSDAGLSSEAIFQFLLANTSKHAINVVYGASYDFNMWLKDVDEATLRHLARDEPATWRGYQLEYRQRKYLAIKHIARQQYIRVWDVIGFFQSSFVKALENWLLIDRDRIGDHDQDHDREVDDRVRIAMAIIRDGKSRRDQFATRDRDFMIEYNNAECRLLVDLMQRLHQLLQREQLKISRWDGVGAIAAALLTRHAIGAHVGGIGQYRSRYQQQVVEDALRHAYFGGRIESFQKGHHAAPGYHADIRSAYPSAMVGLPSFSEGYWEHVGADAWEPMAFGVWHVTWDLQQRHDIYPFAYREATGAVLFPARGENWVHTSELHAALDALTDGALAGDIHIAEGWIWHSAAMVKPFAWMPDLYSRRAALKARGDAAQMVLKLAINACYGKLAQTVGGTFSLMDDGGKVFSKSPRFHNLAWAGAITASTRATMYRAMMRDSGAIIMAVTDGVYATRDIGLVAGDHLGGWEIGTFDEGIFVQAGVYWSRHGDKWQQRTRGFGRLEVTQDDVLAMWSDRRSTMTYNVKRFVTLKAALARREPAAYWRHWLELTRELKTGDMKRNAPLATSHPYHRRLTHTGAAPALSYVIDAAMSAAYNPHWKSADDMLDTDLVGLVDYEDFVGINEGD